MYAARVLTHLEIENSFATCVTDNYQNLKLSITDKDVEVTVYKES